VPPIRRREHRGPPDTGAAHGAASHLLSRPELLNECLPRGNVALASDQRTQKQTLPFGQLDRVSLIVTSNLSKSMLRVPSTKVATESGRPHSEVPERLAERLLPETQCVPRFQFVHEGWAAKRAVVFDLESPVVSILGQEAIGHRLQL
jgi:hypothetical protein